MHRITISLDTLKKERFFANTQKNELHNVLKGIDFIKDAGFKKIKINTVVQRGYNDDELIDLIEFSEKNQLELRFIEYMDVGGATDWKQEKVVFKTRDINFFKKTFWIYRSNQKKKKINQLLILSYQMAIFLVLFHPQQNLFV